MQCRSRAQIFSACHQINNRLCQHVHADNGGQAENDDEIQGMLQQTVRLSVVPFREIGRKLWHDHPRHGGNRRVNQMVYLYDHAVKPYLKIAAEQAQYRRIGVCVNYLGEGHGKEQQDWRKVPPEIQVECQARSAESSPVEHVDYVCAA